MTYVGWAICPKCSWRGLFSKPYEVYECPCCNSKLKPKEVKMVKSGDPFGAPSVDELDVTSDEFSLDMTDERTITGLIPPGDYIAKLIDCGKDTSKAGNEMWVWTFVIVKGDHAGTEMKYFTALTPAAMWKAVEVLEALGLGEMGKIAKFKRGDAINRLCAIKVEDQTYNDRPRSSIKNVMPYPGGAGMKMKDGTTPVV